MNNQEIIAALKRAGIEKLGDLGSPPASPRAFTMEPCSRLAMGCFTGRTKHTQMGARLQYAMPAGRSARRYCDQGTENNAANLAERGKL